MSSNIDADDFINYIDKLDVPILDIGGRRGSTDYIDFIKLKEVSAPVMKGVDCYSRHFVVLKIKGKTDQGDVMDLFQTFFQRYTNNKHTWMGAGGLMYELFSTCGGMKSNHFTAIKDIIEGKIADVSWSYRNAKEKIESAWLSK